jgi:hypothetical protein
MSMLHVVTAPVLAVASGDSMVQHDGTTVIGSGAAVVVAHGMVLLWHWSRQLS